jgi:uncharacterized protein (TIGR02246 family)
MTLRTIFATLLVLCLSASALGSPDVEQTHNELRALRDDMVDAVNKQDVDRLLSHLTPTVVVTFEDAEVARGRDGVRAYYQRMMKGPDAIVQSYQTAVTVDDLTTLYNDDIGVAAGTTDDRFTLSSGMTLSLTGRWTATIVKQDGKWYVAAFHASASMFDNPILTKMKYTVYYVGLFGLVMGLIIGIGVMMVLGRRRRKA